MIKDFFKITFMTFSILKSAFPGQASSVDSLVTFSEFIGALGDFSGEKVFIERTAVAAEIETPEDNPEQTVLLLFIGGIKFEDTIIKPLRFDLAMSILSDEHQKFSLTGVVTQIAKHQSTVDEATSPFWGDVKTRLSVLLQEILSSALLDENLKVSLSSLVES